MKDAFGQELTCDDVVIQICRITEHDQLMENSAVGASLIAHYRTGKIMPSMIRANPGDDTRFKIIRDGDLEIIARP